jgi:hypothetical protein
MVSLVIIVNDILMVMNVIKVVNVGNYQMSNTMPHAIKFM